MLDEFFPRQPQGRAEQPIPAKAQEPVPVTVEESVPEVTAPIDLAELDNIDWSTSPTIDWDTIVEQTDQGFSGLSLEEAQEQGLLSETLASPSEAEEVIAAERPPIDEIDWDIATDIDWDTIVEETDKGLGGMSFEEAQGRGLISDIDPG